MSFTSIGSERVVGWTWSTIAMLVERRAGRLDEAAAIARDAGHYFAQRAERPYESTWSARLAELLYWSADYDGAAHAVADAREGAVGHDVYVEILWRSTAAKLAARRGLTEEAEQLSEQALHLAAASDLRCISPTYYRARRGSRTRRTTRRGHRRG